MFLLFDTINDLNRNLINHSPPIGPAAPIPPGPIYFCISYINSTIFSSLGIISSSFLAITSPKVYITATEIINIIASVICFLVILSNVL